MEILGILFWCGSAFGGAAGGATGGMAPAPPIQEVFERALAHARLQTDAIKKWERKVRRAPLLPRLQFRFDRRLTNSVDVDVSDSVAVNSTGVTVGPTQQKEARDNDSDLTFEVKAVWFLDQLLFSQDDLGISAEARELAHERERILGQARKFYFLRERLLQELLQLRRARAGAGDIEEKNLQVAEAGAALDALTGGWFGERLRGALGVKAKGDL